MNTLDLTIIIPFCNNRDTIGQVLDSIRRSSAQPKEIILVENEGTDGSYQYCEQYIKDQSNITLLRETFPGFSAARNKGLKSCRTEWVYFFDPDDDFDPDYLPFLENVNDEGYDIIATPINIINGTKATVSNFSVNIDPANQILHHTLRTPSLIFRTNYIREIGAWNTSCRIYSDWELGIRTLLHQPSILWYTGKAFHTVHINLKQEDGKSISDNYKNVISTMTTVHNHLHSSILQPLSEYHAQHLSCLPENIESYLLPLYYQAGILLGTCLNKKTTIAAQTDAINAFRKENFQPTLWQHIKCNWYTFLTHIGIKKMWNN